MYCFGTARTTATNTIDVPRRTRAASGDHRLPSIAADETPKHPQHDHTAYESQMPTSDVMDDGG